MAKVLVVEDDPDIRTLLELRLRQAGHRTVSAGTSADAVQVLADRGVPDVMVCDVSLPDGSGLDLVAAWQADPDHARLPVVFLSGRVQPADIEAGRALGAIYLTKPVVLSALCTAIDKAVSAAPSPRGW